MQLTVNNSKIKLVNVVYSLSVVLLLLFLICFRSGEVVDRHGHTVKYYKDVPKILERLHKEGYIIAVASR